VNFKRATKLYALKTIILECLNCYIS